MNFRLFLLAASACVALQGCAHISVGRDRALLVQSGDLMPRIEGLKPEGVSVRHDRVVLRYSFR